MYMRVCEDEYLALLIKANPDHDPLDMEEMFGRMTRVWEDEIRAGLGEQPEDKSSFDLPQDCIASLFATAFMINRVKLS